MENKGALSAISASYANSSSEDEDEEVTPVAVFVKFAGRSELDGGAPTDFKDVKIKEEPRDKEDQPVDAVEMVEINDDDGIVYAGDSYTAVQIKQEPVSSEDSESDSSSSSDDEAAAGDSDSDSDMSESGEKKKDKGEPPKVKGEMSFSDLPPIEDLHISVPREQCKPIGVIKSVVDPLVVVEALPDTPALDIDSVLFLDFGARALGKIYDVIGPVNQPFYCIRFNSLEHMKANGVEKGMPVYCAPATRHTTYVFLAQLRKLKGSDASWLDDIEPPPDAQEFSDDEQERAIRKRRKNKGRPPAHRDQGNPNNYLEMCEGTGYEPLLVPGFRPMPPYSQHGPSLRGRRRGDQHQQRHIYPNPFYHGPGVQNRYSSPNMFPMGPSPLRSYNRGPAPPSWVPRPHIREGGGPRWGYRQATPRHPPPRHSLPPPCHSIPSRPSTPPPPGT